VLFIVYAHRCVPVCCVQHILFRCVFIVHWTGGSVRTPVRYYVVVSTSVYVAGPVPARATLERQLERQLERVTDRAVVLVDCTVVVYGRDPVGTIVLYLVYLIRTVLVRRIHTSPHTSHICLQ
jgi:hypothetical protein